jgi:hypothetical protein
MGQAVNDENTQKRLERILNIWGDRNMFDSKQIAEFRKSLGISYRNNFHYVILNDTFMQNHVSREDLTMENPLSKYQEEIGVRAAKC